MTASNVIWSSEKLRIGSIGKEECADVAALFEATGGKAYAVRLGVTGVDVVREARALLGVRWRHQGRSREGVDCIGLVVVARAALGLSTLDVTDYAKQAKDESMLAYCREHMREITRAELQPGDILVMAYGANRHMAIVADCVYGGLSMIHAHAENRRVVENRLDDSFMARVRGCFRFPEVTA